MRELSDIVEQFPEWRFHQLLVNIGVEVPGEDKFYEESEETQETFSVARQGTRIPARVRPDQRSQAETEVSGPRPENVASERTSTFDLSDKPTVDMDSDTFHFDVDQDDPLEYRGVVEFQNEQASHYETSREERDEDEGFLRRFSRLFNRKGTQGEPVTDDAFSPMGATGELTLIENEDAAEITFEDFEKSAAEEGEKAAGTAVFQGAREGATGNAPHGMQEVAPVEVAPDSFERPGRRPAGASGASAPSVTAAPGTQDGRAPRVAQHMGLGQQLQPMRPQDMRQMPQQAQQQRQQQR